MSEKDVSRRGYVKYAGAGIVVVAVAGAGAYYATRPTTTPPPPTTEAPTEPKPTTPQATPTPTTPAKKITITTAAYPSPASEAMIELSKEYMDLNPNVSINVEILPWDELREKTMLEFASHTGHYDVIMYDMYLLPEYAEGDFLVPLEDYTSIADPDLDDFLSPLLDFCYYKDVLYAYPYYSYCNMLGYRKDLFEQNGISRIPDTWDEFIDTAKILTQDTDNDGKINLYGTSMFAKRGAWIVYDWATFLWSHGGQYIDDKMQATFNSREGIDALQLYVDILQKHKIAPEGCVNWDEDPYTRSLAEGLCAMGYGVVVEAIPWLEDPEKSNVVGLFEYDIIPGVQLSTTEGADVKRHPAVGEFLLSLNTDSKNLEEAYKWMAWVSSKEKHEDYIRFGGIPVRKAVLETGIVDEPKYRWLKPYIESMPHGKSYGMGGSPRAPFPEWGEIQEPIGLALSQALVKERKVKEALDWAAGEATKVLKRAGYDKQYGWS